MSKSENLVFDRVFSWISENLMVTLGRMEFAVFASGRHLTPN